MDIFTDRRCFLIAVSIYGVSVFYSVFLWRQGLRRDTWINYLGLLLGFVFHTMAMLQRGFTLNRCPITNLFEATMFIGWSMLALYLLLGLWPRVRFLGVFASPILFMLGVFALMPALDVRGPQPKFFNAWSSLHASLSLLAYGAFGLSCVAGLMFLSQEYNLKYNKLRAVTSLLPSLQRLEQASSRLLVAGLMLLSIGLWSGFIWLKHEKGVYFLPDPKIIWSGLVWVMYLGLLLARWRFAQRGRRLAVGSVAVFAFVVLTFWGSNLLSTIHRP
jgi:ABC-type uncharacterized transport system permease subunit